MVTSKDGLQDSDDRNPKNVATTLEPLTTNPNLPELISAIIPADTSLSAFLEEANTASSGILPLVAQE